MSRHCQNRTTRNGRLVLCGGPMELIRTTPKGRKWYRCTVCQHKELEVPESFWAEEQPQETA